tara:strand:- start:1122 stop:1346 length:225 start_codon:yes stop_codon:yes gene_type:complete
MELTPVSIICDSTGSQSVFSISSGSIVKTDIPKVEIIIETIRKFLGTLVNANVEPTIKESSAWLDGSSDIISPS